MNDDDDDDNYYWEGLIFTFLIFWQKEKG